MKVNSILIFILLIMLTVIIGCSVSQFNSKTADQDSISGQNGTTITDTVSRATTVGNISSNLSSPYINILQSSSGKYLVTINLRPNGCIPYSRVEFAINPSGTGSGFQVNIGDSSTNNGWAGDAATQENDSEIVIYNNNLYIYAGDKGKSEQLVYKPGWWDNRPIYFSIKNNQIRYTRYYENGITLVNKNIFHLNGQPDAEGPVNYTIYAAFNRVIDGEYRSGTGAGTVTINFYDPVPANVYYGHLHNHTLRYYGSTPHGKGTPDEAYKYARDNAKLDFFGIADHDLLLNDTDYAALKKTADSYNRDGSFATFYGFEWSHDQYGHVAVINASSLIRCDNTNYNTFTKLVNWLSSHTECVAFLNHPGRQDSTGTEFNHFTGTYTDQIVGMELWNKTDGFSTYFYNTGYDSRSTSYYDEANLNGWKIGASGSEDNHDATWGNMTNYRMAVLATGKTRAAIFDAIKKRRFYATSDKNLKLWLQIDDQPMGSEVKTPSTLKKAIVKVEDPDNELIKKVQFFRTGYPYYEYYPNTRYVYLEADLDLCYNNEFCYVKVTQEDGDEAISSPVFIKY